MKPNVYENILEEQYSRPEFLMPPQRVIFQEGIRGNHLLFPGWIGEFNEQTAISDKVAEVGAALLLANSVQEMRDVINNAKLNLFQTAELLTLYKRWLKRVKEKAGMDLN